MRDSNGVMFREREAVKRRCTEHFEKLMKVENWGDAVVICLGMNAYGRRAYEQDSISREAEIWKRFGGRLKAFHL